MWANGKGAKQGRRYLIRPAGVGRAAGVTPARFGAESSACGKKFTDISFPLCYNSIIKKQARARRPAARRTARWADDMMTTQGDIAEKPLGIGVVGTNFISDWMLEAAQALPQVRFAAVCSRAQATGDAFAQKHGGLAVYTDYAAMLADAAVQAVYIASPNCAHGQQALQAIAAGRHVLCEKPMAVTGRQFAAMRRAAATAGVVLLEAMRPVYDPALQLIKQQLPLLGPIRRVSLEFCQYSSRYDRFLAGQTLNAFDPSLDNAALLDIGVYCVAVCAALFGRPRRVQANSRFLQNGFEAGGVLLLEYDGFCADIVYSKVCDSVRPSVITGEKGSLTIDKIGMPAQITLCKRGEAPAALPYTPVKNNMVYELAAFAAAVAAGDIHHAGLDISGIQADILTEARLQAGVRLPADDLVW